MTRPCVLVDTREQRPLLFSCRVATERATLDAGDYSLKGLEHLVRIERKGLEDLARCCCKREAERFYAGPRSQMRRLRRFRWRWLVVEATRSALSLHPMIRQYRSEVPPSRIRDITEAIEVGGVPVQWLDSPEVCAAWVERILCRVLAAVQAQAKAEPSEAASA